MRLDFAASYMRDISEPKIKEMMADIEAESRRDLEGTDTLGIGGDTTTVIMHGWGADADWNIQGMDTKSIDIEFNADLHSKGADIKGRDTPGIGVDVATITEDS